MLNLTDPTLAPLIARYRAWVEVGNERINEENWAGYKKNVAHYNATPWFLRFLDEEPCVPWLYKRPPTHEGFLDWCIREGIEVPKGEA